MIKIRQMNAVALKVRDLEQSMDWYRRHFGFEFLHKAEGCVVIGVRNAGPCYIYSKQFVDFSCETHVE